ncbi:hypothetical protein [Streptomyces goshikiensis]|uniref:hypothetical protein n=1 Tax=Streptomyces goshikiensis TaxID=1942 RepID=UPI0036DAEE53
MGKKSFRKVPDALRAKIAQLAGDSYQVGVRRHYSVGDVEAGALSHMGIGVENGSLEVPTEALPPGNRGRFSRWNLAGRVVRRADLPKVERTWGIETPNFGDWSKGSHTINFTRLVYQTEIAFGQQIPIVMGVDHQPNGEVDIAFRVDQTFSRKDTSDRDLIFALSLLQENVGAVDVVESARTTSDWLATMPVDWEFLPVGSRDDMLAEVARHVGAGSSGERKGALEERMGALLDLSPINLVYGMSGFQRYLGAQFTSDLVVFENVQYGNALYVMYERWEELSKKSRIELLAGPGRGFERIPHRRGWEGRLRYAVNSRRNESE